MDNLLIGNLDKEHYKPKDNYIKKTKSKCYVGDYDNKMKLNNNWKLPGKYDKRI